MHVPESSSSPPSVSISSSSIVLMQDVFKLGISLLIIRMKSNNWTNWSSQIYRNKKYAVLYLVPSVLYSLYNNLAFFGLSNFDPTTYFVLMQFRIIVVTFFSIFFLHKTVNSNQWLGLIMVTGGAVMKIFDSSSVDSSFISIPLFPFLLVQLQLVLSATAGIYNEFLLQGKNRPSTEIQNVFMYSDSILVGFLSSKASHTRLMHPILIFAIVVSGSAAGLLASYFLRHLDSVRKSIASAIELWITAILSAIVFGYPISGFAVFGLAIITLGIFNYSKT